jgi:predicted dehydrogenase
MVGFNRRFSLHSRKIKELLRDRKNPIIIHYRLNGGYIPPNSWVQNEEGGGRIIGEACHMFDMFNYLTGSKVKDINSHSATFGPNSKYISGDNVAVTLTYEDGSICNLIYTASGDTNLSKERVEVFCEGKSFVIDDFKNLEIYGYTGGLKGKETDKGHLQELFEMAEALKELKEMPITLEDIISATKISFTVNKQL